MAYSTNPETLRSFEEEFAASLRPLKRMEACSWTFADAATARQFSYRLREAFSIARLHAKQFPAWAKAADFFIVETTKRNVIQAVPKGSRTPTQTARIASQYSGESQTPTQAGEPFGAPPDRVGMTTAEQIVASWMDHQPSNDKIYFIQTRLSNEELMKLYVWSRAKTPKLMFFVTEDTLTLSLREPDAEPFAWKPKVETKKVEEKLDL